MGCAFGCNMCNKCGKFDDLLNNMGKRTCVVCGEPAPDNAVKCEKCGAILPPPFSAPGVSSSAPGTAPAPGTTSAPGTSAASAFTPATGPTI